MRLTTLVRFSKWHALGNSYLLVEPEAAARPVDADLVRRVCDVRRGVGSDGVLEIVRVDGAEVEITIWNPDGSKAEFSGNGTRLAAMWLAECTGADEVAVRVGTAAYRARRRGALVEMEVGQVSVAPAETLAVDGDEVEFVPVSVGNPHAVVRRAPVREELLRLGPLLERHDRFPERTNVQLADAAGAGTVRALVWERGAGETSASGSSAVAVAAAAVAGGWAESPVTVSMPGGDLAVALDAAGRAWLTGPAVEIARGELVL